MSALSKKCLCEPQGILIFSCSGGSNVGQIANQVAITLTRGGVGEMFCLAGIGGHISDVIESAKAGKRIVVIDGCAVGCAKKTLDHTSLEVTDYVIVTELGIKKNHNFGLQLESVANCAEKVKKSLEKEGEE